jgi:DnaJ-domain-containing protein 1
MLMPKNGTAAGIGVSLLTLGLGPTDLIVGPLVRSYVNKRTQARRESSSAEERTFIQIHGLIAISNCPELLYEQSSEREILTRFAFAYQPPGNYVSIDHSMSEMYFKQFISSQIARVQSSMAELNALLCDFVVHFQWVDLGQVLLQVGYPISHLLTGQRGGQSGSSSQQSTERQAALLELGLDETASPDDIKRAYRTLSMSFHPDRLIGASDEQTKEAEIKMQQINAAYPFLNIR